MFIGDIVQYCSDPALGSFLAIIKQIFFMLLVITPVLLILSLFVLGFRKVRNPEDKKINGSIQNAVTAAIVVILLPLIVNLLMYALNYGVNSRFVVSECWNASRVFKGNSTYHYYERSGKKTSYIIDPSQYVGFEGNPNYRPDRVPVDDEGDYLEGSATSFGDIVWDPKDVTKISNLTSADFIKILKSHSKSAKNFVPYAQDLISAEQMYKVNVFFLTAVDAHESAWITSAIAKSCNNLGGVTESSKYPSNGCGSNPGHKFAYFNSISQYIKYHADLLHSSYLTKGGPYYNGKSVEAVRKKYCPNGDGGCSDWTPGVLRIANSLFNQAKNIAFSSSNKAENIAKAAEYYAWPLGTPKSKYCRFNGGGNTKQFMTDYRKWWPNMKNKSDKSVAAGTCCCHFARTCVVKGINKKFSFTLLPNDSSRDEATRKKMEQLGFVRFKFDGSVSSLKRGDVLYYRNKGHGGHVWIYLGNNKAAEGSHSSGYGGRITKVDNYKVKTSNKSVYYVFRAK